MEEINASVFITITQSGFEPANVQLRLGDEATFYNARQETVLLKQTPSYRIFLPVVQSSKAANSTDVANEIEVIGNAVQPDSQPIDQSLLPEASGVFTHTLKPGESFTYRFEVAGQFTIRFDADQTYTGLIIVVPEQQPDSTATPTTMATHLIHPLAIGRQSTLCRLDRRQLIMRSSAMVAVISFINLWRLLPAWLSGLQPLSGQGGLEWQ